MDIIIQWPQEKGP